MEHGRILADQVGFVRVGNKKAAEGDLRRMRQILRDGLQRQIKLAKSPQTANGNRTSLRVANETRGAYRWWTEENGNCLVRLRYGCAYLDRNTTVEVAKDRLVAFFEKTLQILDTGALDEDLKRFVRRTKRRLTQRRKS